MQTEQDKSNNISSNNNMVLSLQQRVFSKSNINLFFINREKTGNSNLVNDQEKFNRVLGVDYNLRSKNSKWSGSLFYHNSMDEIKKDDSYSTGIDLLYNSKNHGVYSKIISIGEGFESDLGFIRRKGIFKQFLDTKEDFGLKQKRYQILVYLKILDI